MIRTSSVALLFASCLLAACGGGSGGFAPPQPATLDGGVTQVDGVTSNLSGIEFVLVETGQHVVTGPDGTFELTGAPVGSFTLALVGAEGDTAVTGAAAYAANCSACHGTDGSGPPNARGTTASAYAAALSRGSMAGITLSTTDYDEIFTFLSDTPAPTPTPTPPPTGGVDGATVYTSKCSSCHGADGNGPPSARGTTDAEFSAALARAPMSSITLTTAEYDAVFAYLADGGTPPPPPPTDESDGAVLYRASCAACHGDFGVPANAAGGNRQVLGARACTIEASLTGTSVFPGGVPTMAGLKSLTTAQIDAIAGYLNSQPVTGEQRYVANCAGCHGMSGAGGRVGESVTGESSSETWEAISEESTMTYLNCLPADDIDAISAYLQGSTGGTGDDDDDDHDGDDDDGDDDDDHSDEHDADEIEDGDECSEGDVSLHGVTSGERIRVRVRIADGRIERVDVSRVGHDEREVELFLQPTDANDDADMTARLELEQRSDRSRIQVTVEHATVGRELEFVFMDATGGESSIGVRTVGADGEAAWELDTAIGSLLPFGVGSLSELEGYTVELRDTLSGTALLRSKSPELPTAAPVPSGSDSDSGEGVRLRGRARLSADVTGPKGYVEVCRRPDEGREGFEIEAEDLSAGRVVEFFIEDVGSPGAYLSLGARTADAEGEVELELDTEDGASLPGGALSAAALVGLGVQVRDATTDQLLLHGTVPALSQD